MKEARKESRKDKTKYCNKFKGRQDEERVKDISKDEISATGNI